MGTETVVQASVYDTGEPWDVWADVADGIMRIADAEARIASLTGVATVYAPVTATLRGNIPWDAGQGIRDEARARRVLATLRDIVASADESALGEHDALARIESAYDASAERFAAFCETLATVRP